MNKVKVKKIVSAVALGMAVIMCVSLVAALFSGSSGGGTSSGKLPGGTSAAPSDNTIIGVSWDRSKSAESTSLTRLTTYSDNFVTTNIKSEPVPGVGSVPGSSPFDNYYPWNAMKEYNVIDNKIAYSSSDPGFSRTEYDTVVYIPEFYYRVVDDGNTRKFYVAAKATPGFELHPGSGNYVAKYNSSEAYTSVSGATPVTSITRADVRTNAAAKGDNWSGYDYATWNAIQMLYIVEYADWDSQTKIGRGIVDADDFELDTTLLKTGDCDTMAYHTGRASGENGITQVQYRYIEGLWGTVCEWVDGINITDRSVYVSLDYKNYADDTTEGYIASGVSLPTTGHIKNIGHSFEFPWAFIPSESFASTAYDPIYIPDKVCSGDGWRILYTSNNSEGDDLAGLFRFSTSSASDRVHETYGCRLVFHGE